MEVNLTDYRLHNEDTGSASYQCASLSSRIRDLTDHLKQHPKDFSSKRGLLRLVARRKKFLASLKKSNEQKYQLIVENFALRG